MTKTKVIIMGAAGRDFHNFNVHFRDRADHQVVAFTAAQIPSIEGRIYPPELAGPLYPQGIPIHPESALQDLIREHEVDQVIFAYSDVSYQEVMHKASLVLAAGADFHLMGSRSTMLRARVPVISVCAVRTGSGKSQTTRRVAALLKEMGFSVVVVRHPMPYGQLDRQALQRFSSYQDLDLYQCTIEEREEYEPLIGLGLVVYAGVDYQRILKAAQREGDVLLWDGGNNDLPFYWPNLHIVVADPHRPGHELSYHPGETNVRMADVVVINKVDTADAGSVATVRGNVWALNPRAIIVEAASRISVQDGTLIRGKRVLVVEDGPSLTHGGMSYGAGKVAAERHGAAALVDPRPYAVGSILETFRANPHIGPVLPAVGYNREQIRELEETIASAPCDLVLVATPVDLGRVLRVNKTLLRVSYELEEIGEPDLRQILREALGQAKARRGAQP